jgi:hypothetical protein
MLGIARSMLGQPIDLVLMSFDSAQELDPENEQIRHNRAIAQQRAAAAGSAPKPKLWGIPPMTDVKVARRAAPPSTIVQGEVASAERGNRLADMLVTSTS